MNGDSINHNDNSDVEFSIFVEKHKFSSYMILGITGLCHFKSFKMFYSYFFMFDMFKAKWNKATFLRQSMIKWQLAYLCTVDLTLIGISAFGLTKVQWGTQLFIAMIETIVLSILAVVVGIVEKF